MQEKALGDYIYNLNKKAIQLDIRSMAFVPPHGMVLTMYCSKNNNVIFGLANGRGGIAIHKPPEEIVFHCIDKNRKTFLSKLKNLFSKK